MIVMRRQWLGFIDGLKRKKSVRCPRCKQEKGLLLVTGRRELPILKYETLCADCDTELRKKYLFEIEQLYPMMQR